MVKKCLGFILVLVLCIQMGSNIPVGYAEESKVHEATSVKGKIHQAETTNKNVSLEGVEIQVFSSELDKGVEADDIEVYNSTYKFSVFCDADGNYSFVPPSKDYAVAVNLASLPEKIGVTETNFFEYTLAHEMYHAISFTYRYDMDDRWFDEAFASWAGLRYTANGANVAEYVRPYLENTTVSPQDMNGDYKLMRYGMCVYALTLDLYNGGIATIRAILEATEDTSKPYTAIQNGIDAVNQSYTLAGEAFNYCSLYICEPTEFYSWATTEWGTASNTLRSDSSSYTVTGDSFTSSRHVYNLYSSSAKTLSISIQRNAGVLGTGVVRNKADGTTEVIAPTSSVGDLTTYVISNYGTTYRSEILSIVNGSTSSDNLNCTVTSSLN